MGDSDSDFRRILIVGCSRSGTTLLQSLFASHSRVHTFPETGVFLKAFGMRATVLPWARLGLTLGKERKTLARLLSSQRPTVGPLPALPPRRISISHSVSDVVAFLDSLAKAHGKDSWVEKTPRHVFHAARIQRAIPGALCLHMVRNGRDVVASIVDRARKYPDRFPRQANPAYGIRQWNRSMKATELAIRESGHAVVFYESLVTGVERTMRTLCGVVGLEFEAGMLAPADRERFTSPDEEWKSNVNASVEAAPSKFRSLFDEATQDRITRRLELSVFDRMLEKAAKGPGGVLVSGGWR